MLDGVAAVALGSSAPAFAMVAAVCVLRIPLGSLCGAAYRNLLKRAGMNDVIRSTGDAAIVAPGAS